MRVKPKRETMGKRTIEKAVHDDMMSQDDKGAQLKN